MQAVLQQLRSVVSAAGNQRGPSSRVSSEGTQVSRGGGTVRAGVNNARSDLKTASGAAVAEDISKVVEMQQVAVDSSARSDLNWAHFVTNMTDKGSKILSEHLKRLGVEEFSAGKLVASGPEFSVNYLNQKENQAKIIAGLLVYSNIGQWSLDLRGVKPGASSSTASLLQQEENSRKQQHAEKKEIISNHPKIKSLQKIFPGSTIENIKIRD